MLRLHRAGILDLAFFPKGDRLITGGADHSAIIWDAATGKPLHILRRHYGFVTAVLVFPDGSKVLTCSNDGLAVIWSASTGKVLHRLRLHSERLARAVVFPEGDRVATCGWDGRIGIWDVYSGKLLQVLVHQQAALIDIQVFPDGDRLLSYSYRDGRLRIWSLSSGHVLQTLQHLWPIVGAAVSDDGNLLVTATSHGIFVWDLPVGQVSRMLTSFSQGAMGVEFVPGSSNVVVFGNSADITILDALSGKVVHTMKVPSQQYVRSVALSAGGELLATCSPERVLIWDLGTGALMRVIEQPQETELRLNTVCGVAIGPAWKAAALDPHGFSA